MVKVLDWIDSDESRKALKFYKSLRISKDDLYRDSWKCNEDDNFKIVLHFDENNDECGLLFEKERESRAKEAKNE